MNEDYTGVESLEVLKEAKNYNHFIFREVVRNNPAANQSKMILDFGAGIGTFSEMVRTAGHEVHCVEKDVRMAQRLRDNGFQTYEDLAVIEEGKFPYIYSLNVLEHIENHQETLTQLCRCLQKGGVLYLYVPAFNLIYSSMDKQVGHYRRYTFSTLLPLLEKAGLTVEKAEYVDSLGFGAALVFKYLGNKEGNLDRNMVKLYDRFLFPLSRITDSFLKNWFGKNLSVRAIKKN